MLIREDQNDSEIFYRYDAINRPVQSLSPRPSDAGRAFSITQTDYNEAGLVQIAPTTTAPGSPRR